MYCKYCGERIEDGSRVCRFCGKKQEDFGEVRIVNSSISSSGGRINNSNFGRNMGAGFGAGFGANNCVITGVGANIRKSTKRKNISTNVDNRGGLIQHSSIGSVEGRIEICPYCGKELNFPKPPRFCPYCKEQIME